MEGKPDWLSGFPVQIYCNRNDCISDEVEYEYHDILKELDNFIYAQNCLIEKDTRIAEIISEAIKTNGDNT